MVQTDRRKHRLVIFDWNGTVQDDAAHFYAHGVRDTFAHYGLACPTLKQWRDETGHDYLPSYHRHGIPANVTAEELDAIAEEALRGEAPELFPEAVEVIRRLKADGHRLIVVSAWQSVALTAAVARHRLDPCFELVVGGVKKDKASAFAECISRLSALPEMTAVVGDMVDDAFAATRIGARPILCPRGFHSRERIERARASIPSLVIIETLGDLLEVL